jgi:hypothetical protein
MFFYKKLVMANREQRNPKLLFLNPSCYRSEVTYLSLDSKRNCTEVCGSLPVRHYAVTVHRQKFYSSNSLYSYFELCHCNMQQGGKEFWQ